MTEFKLIDSKGEVLLTINPFDDIGDILAAVQTSIISFTSLHFEREDRERVPIHRMNIGRFEEGEQINDFDLSDTDDNEYKVVMKGDKIGAVIAETFKEAAKAARKEYFKRQTDITFTLISMDGTEKQFIIDDEGEIKRKRDDVE